MRIKIHITILFLAVLFTANCFASEDEVLNSKQTMSWELKAFIATDSLYFEYDINGNVNICNIYQWENNGWILDSKRTYYYDGNNKLIEDITEKFIADTFKYSTKNQFIFDENNNLVDSTYIVWSDSASKWIDNYKTSSTFNSEGQKILSLGQRWRNNNWENNRQYTYHYNLQNLLDTVYSKRYQQGSWRNNAVIIYSYDENNNLKEAITQTYWGPNLSNFSKIEYVYENNMLTEQSNYSWSNNEWILQDLRKFIYDETNKLINIIIMRNDNVGWLAKTQNSYLYDEKNNKVRDLTQQYVDEQLQNFRRTDYTYNESNQMTEELAQNWTANSNSWTNQAKKEYSYYPDGKKHIDYNYSWRFTQEWGYTSSSTYTYNEATNSSTVSNQKYVDSISTWINTTRTSTTFTSDGKPLLAITEKWNEMNSWWRNSAKSEYTYDESGFLIKTDDDKWLYNFEDDYMHFYTNDANGNRIEYLGQDFIDSVWTNDYKYIYTYDSENRLISQLYLDWQNSDWDSTEKQILIYGEPVILGIEELINSSLINQIYPNPFSTKTVIYFELNQPANVELKVFNRIGFQVFKSAPRFYGIGNNQIEFNSENLSSGMYYVTIITEEKQDTKKMVIIK